MQQFSFDMIWESFTKFDLPMIRIKDVIEMCLIAFAIYQLLKWIRGTRAWTLFKGMIIIFIVFFLASVLKLHTILWVFRNTINVGIIALVIVFQPELRSALEQLGRRDFVSTFMIFDDDNKERITLQSIEELIKAINQMSKYKTGALIVIEREVGLGEYERTGIPIHADISSELLINIFEHNTPLHDGAVIIRHNQIVAATCYLPLSDNMSLSKELGTRHRAAVGITEVSDSVVIIISEETGKISMAMGGNIIRNVDSDYLRNKLAYQKKTADIKKFKLWKGRQKDG
ncbi:TIGR00159 family protein [Vallitalea pronyensis]|uniref:Diadenylate cyclase n=1 Tax=Vallitalea pronyensis TaxID=1348613 RepID=A0A8J8MH68_9FIRM|nr:diadenylate cyclase CdaA [Vallitalea pronyensis]QUI21575.1 TIGR00159 family protein [Vallitalea pronyensis]